MTAKNSRNEPPEKLLERQRVCVHRFDAWYVPYWDPKNKYRTCLNCEIIERKYIGW